MALPAAAGVASFLLPVAASQIWIYGAIFREHTLGVLHAGLALGVGVALLPNLWVLGLPLGAHELQMQDRGAMSLAATDGRNCLAMGVNFLPRNPVAGFELLALAPAPAASRVLRERRVPLLATIALVLFATPWIVPNSGGRPAGLAAASEPGFVGSARALCRRGADARRI